ncbi:MAG: UdgX family uracil-DNA binding protein [Vitreimonas sp.]
MIAVDLAPTAGFAEWREKARALVAARAAPDTLIWRGENVPELFGAEQSTAAKDCVLSVPRAFVEIAEMAALHRDTERFALLYRVLWRLQSERRLMDDAADPDVLKVRALAKAVARDEHKMHAFVRFREVADTNGPRYVAWFEPQHHITLKVADFFVKRFAGMRWSIVTPDASLHWDGEALAIGPGGKRSDVPTEDARDEDWRAYYESMFNPARLKVRAMQREMPKHYWRNLPEAAGIPHLIRNASNRTDAMVHAHPTTPRKRAGAAHAKIKPENLPGRLEPVAEHEKAPASIKDLNHALSACRACPLWRDATQAVAGEGRTDAPLLALVGEQPGDQEDLAGRPFVGPAGRVLDRALEAAGIERSEIFITNAVKHFKHEPRGKRRLHKRPDKGEAKICRWWVKNELELVAPTLVVALGVTALQSLSVHKGSLTAVRETTLKTREGRSMRATIHPSALLRLPDEADKDAEFDRFVADLKSAKSIAKTLK